MYLAVSYNGFVLVIAVCQLAAAGTAKSARRSAAGAAAADLTFAETVYAKMSGACKWTALPSIFNHIINVN